MSLEEKLARYEVESNEKWSENQNNFKEYLPKLETKIMKLKKSML